MFDRRLFFRVGAGVAAVVPLPSPETAAAGDVQDRDELPQQTAASAQPAGPPSKTDS